MTHTFPQNRTTDVVVLGSGAAGLTAAVTAAQAGADVVVVEKAGVVGGTSAWSGGHVWIPVNPHMPEGSEGDCRDAAVGYLMSLSRGLMDRDLVTRYVDTGPEMVRFLDRHANTEFEAVALFPDYHPEFPGGRPEGGRTLECRLFSFQALGEWAARVSPSPYYRNPHVKMGETPLCQSHPEPVPDAEMERRRAGDERGSGQALVGRLLRACLDHGVEFLLGHRAVELLTKDGHVSGVAVETSEAVVPINAAGGVILGTGGFEWNENLKRAFLRGPLTHPISPPTNTGDGLIMAQKVGAELGNMREAWWAPVAEMPEHVNIPMNRILIAAQRTYPHSIMVNRHGRRFTNEAANYNAFGGAFHEEDVARFEYRNQPCWLIFDQTYVDRFGALSQLFGDGREDALNVSSTLPGLAAGLSIPADELEHTVDRWNGLVTSGRDTDFLRGDSAFDRWWGDPRHRGTHEATLGRLETPPFYALPIHSGALGTKGGPQVDEDSRVLSIDGGPIEGLYAAGNVMASAFGMTYGGAGGTLGPAMVFGFLAGRHAARRVKDRLTTPGAPP